MSEADWFGERVEEFFEEDDHSTKINRAILGVEVRISLDTLMGYKEAKLIDEEGKSHDVSMKTVERYRERNYLINQYTSRYGKKPEFEAAKQKWRYCTD